VFSWENLDNAKTAYNKLVAKVATLKDEGEIDNEAIEKGRAIFREALDNDLNTSLAVTAIYDCMKMSTTDKTKLALIAEFDTVLGLDLIAHANAAKEEEQGEADGELVAYIKERIEARRLAKAARDFATADAIRAELLEKGITLVDKREGTEFIIN
jgi:cysteinyl-tRNA synthetase